MKFKIEHNQLMIETDDQINLVEIKKRVDLNESEDTVLFLEDNSFFEAPCNLICIANNPTLKWVIEKKEYPENRFEISNIYIEGDKLFVYRYIGIEEEIDIQNGKIISSELIK
jgi:hypothetical protein